MERRTSSNPAIDFSSPLVIQATSFRIVVADIMPSPVNLQLPLCFFSRMQRRRVFLQLHVHRSTGMLPSRSAFSWNVSSLSKYSSRCTCHETCINTENTKTKTISAPPLYEL